MDSNDAPSCGSGRFFSPLFVLFSFLFFCHLLLSLICDSFIPLFPLSSLIVLPLKSCSTFLAVFIIVSLTGWTFGGEWLVYEFLDEIVSLLLPLTLSLSLCLSSLGGGFSAVKRSKPGIRQPRRPRLLRRETRVSSVRLPPSLTCPTR
ncbi:hypothetical protein J3F83DRAFT_13094 [Trichoderma novae-zelandiae]